MWSDTDYKQRDAVPVKLDPIRTDTDYTKQGYDNPKIYSYSSIESSVTLATYHCIH
ncbi:MAG: hypothetical protein I8H80_01720 [Alphaproteobacteria bacterium]|nr:hypothetical protein [Alphaproteobacteria bacterium]